MKLKKEYFDKEILLESLKNDKKRVGKNLTIIIAVNDEIQAIKADDFTVNEFEDAYNKLITILEL
jgi:hypothetical protein